MSSKRDQFEHQLRDLQNDISSLSQKLNLSSIKTNSKLSKELTTYENSNNKLAYDKMQAIPMNISSNNSKYERNEKLDHLRQELHLYKKERDDAIYKFEQLKVEMEEMRKSLQDAMRIKASYEHLKQEYDSIKISLESSERIRKQQKELINLLQRSHSLAIANDSSSVISFNSLSSISIKGAGGYDDIPTGNSNKMKRVNTNNIHSSNTKQTSIAISPSEIATENKNWLNTATVLATSKSTNNSPNIKPNEQRKSKRRSSISSNNKSNHIPNNNKKSSSLYDPVLNKRKLSIHNEHKSMINNNLNNNTTINATNTSAIDLNYNNLDSSYQSILNMNDSLVPSVNGQYDMNLNATDDIHNNSYNNVMYKSSTSSSNVSNPVYSYEDSSNTRGKQIEHRSSIIPTNTVIAATSGPGKPPRHPSINSNAIINNNYGYSNGLNHNADLYNNNTYQTSLLSPSTTPMEQQSRSSSSVIPVREPSLYYNQQHYLLNQANEINSNIINKINDKRPTNASNNSSSISIRSRQSNLLMNRPPPKHRMSNNIIEKNQIKKKKEKNQSSLNKLTSRQFKKPVSSPLTTFGSASRRF